MLFFELIRIAIGNGKTLSHTPTDKEWQDLFEEAQRQTLLGVFYSALNQLPSEQRPPRQILIDSHAAIQKIVSDNQRLNHDCIWLSKRWEKLGYRNVILKGQGNAQLYPDPLLRTPGDIDIWLDGNQKKIVNYIRSHFPKVEVTRIEMDFPIKRDTPIEIHFIPSFLYDPFKNRHLQQYYRAQLKQTKQIELPNEGVICIPNDEMNLVFQLTHIYRHLFYEGIGLRQLLDYYYLLKSLHVETTRNGDCITTDDRNNNKEIIEKAIITINKIGLKDFARALMWVLREVFNMPSDWMLFHPDKRRGEFLLKEIMLAGNFGHADDRVGNWTEMNRWQRLIWGTKWSWRLIGQYPREVLWHPYYRVSQYFWRVCNGYL